MLDGKRTKQAGRYNATKHGIFATALCNSNFLKKEEGDFLVILEGLRNTFRPTNAFEDIQIAKITFLHLRLLRLYKADWRVAPKLFQKVSEALDEDHEVIEKEFVDKEEQVVVLRRDPSPELLIRYETHIEKQIGRALDQLMKFRGATGSHDGV